LTHTVTGLSNDTEYTFTLTALDIGGNRSGGVTIKLTPRLIISLAEVADYLNAAPGGASASDPVPLPVNISKNSEWEFLLDVIQTAGKYIALDLSACSIGGPEFDLRAPSRAQYIASLILPNAATSVKAGRYFSSTFQDFTSLRSIAGTNVLNIGDYAFSSCNSLETVSFPVAETIDVYAFSDCSALETVSLPVAVSIGREAFSHCTSLETVSLPVAETIGGAAFSDCTSLETVSLPAAETIGVSAFYACTVLETVNLPAAVTIAHDAFRNCASLRTVNLAAAENIGAFNFYDCPSLRTVNLPVVENIGFAAFSYIGSSALTITMGARAPTLGGFSFNDVFEAKTVTVKVPSGATGYGSSPIDTTANNWGNGFRGGGWDGSTIRQSNYANENIILYIQYNQ
jgi:hypothetical protein